MVEKITVRTIVKIKSGNVVKVDKTRAKYYCKPSRHAIKCQLAFNTRSQSSLWKTAAIESEYRIE